MCRIIRNPEAQFYQESKFSPCITLHRPLACWYGGFSAVARSSRESETSFRQLRFKVPVAVCFQSLVAFSSRRPGSGAVDMIGRRAKGFSLELPQLRSLPNVYIRPSADGGHGRRVRQRWILGPLAACFSNGRIFHLRRNGASLVRPKDTHRAAPN